MTDSLFLKVLSDKYPALQAFAASSNKFKVFIPSSSYILEGHLCEYFYNNHIFYQSPYDESIYINLNGKMLQSKGNKLEAYFGWTKPNLQFTIKGDVTTYKGLFCVTIDGICDDSDNKPSSSAIPKKSKEERKLQQYSTKDEYMLKFYPIVMELHKATPLRSIQKINELIYKYKNNVIFMKGYEEYYALNFVDHVNSIFEVFGDDLRQLQIDENVINVVKYELVDSIIFDELYDFIFGNLKQFHSEDDFDFQMKLSTLPNKFEFTKENEPFRECQFTLPIQQLKKLTMTRCLFEKVNLITEVNNLIGIEAKEVYERATKKQYNPQGDLLLTLWCNLIARANVIDILAEAAFLKNFNFYSQNSHGESSYLTTTFISAVKTVYDEYTKDINKTDLSQHIQCIYIDTRIPNEQY